jgi:hypothetical protein
MLSGVVSAATFLDALQTVFFELQEERRKKELDMITRDRFDLIDTDHNGFLSRGEFLEHVILKHHLLDREIVRHINSMYDQMDVNDDQQVCYAKIHHVTKKRGRF